MTTISAPIAHLDLSVDFTAPSMRPTKLLMCPPAGLMEECELAPWMSRRNECSGDPTCRAWYHLYRTLYDEIGVEIELIRTTEASPNMMFTANAGLVRGQFALLSNFRYPQKQLEEANFRRWFEANGYKVQSPSIGCKFEGERDAIHAGGMVLAGYYKRSEICAHRWLSETLALPVMSLQLIDDSLTHLDNCLFPLGDDTVVYYPGAFDEYARRVISNSFLTIEVSKDDAVRLGCSALTIDNQVVLPAGCSELAFEIEKRGYVTHSVDVSPFQSSAAGCKGLVLTL